MKLIKRLLMAIKMRLFCYETIGLFISEQNKTVSYAATDIRWATQANLADILNFQPARYVEVFRDFLALGDKGYYTYLDGQCVHRSWVKSNEQVVYPHWAYPMKLQPNQHFIHYCETAPQARGKGIYPAVLSKIVDDFKHKGEILMSINAKNTASIKGAQKAGFVERESKSAGDFRPEIHHKTGLRVLMITQGVSRLVEPLLNSQHQVVGILESAPRNYKKQPGQYKLMGIARFFYSKIKRKQVSLKNKAEQAGLPYHFMTSSDQPGLVEWIKDLKPDIIVVFSMSQLLKEKIFTIPKYGAINLHPAILPEYRGPNPDFWQYYNMEINPGVTVHYIDKGEDTGDIIFQERTHIPLGIKSPPRLDKLIGETGTSLVLKALDAIQAGTAPRIKQPAQSATPRAKNLAQDEHKTIVDWQSWPIERIWHVLRGTELWLNALPQPKGLWKGQRWVIEGYEKQPTQTTKPGKVGKQNGRYHVACKDGRIYLTRKFSVKNLIVRLLKS